MSYNENNNSSNNIEENNINNEIMENDTNKNSNLAVKLFIIIPVAILCIIIICLILTNTCVISHNWNAATCEKPKTCARCDEIEGKALGHNYTDATCDKPKTCTVCGKTSGKPLGHKVSNWTTLKEATCTEDGRKSGLCSVCNKEVEEDIAATGHKPGDLEVAKEASLQSEGEKVQKCQVCGEIVSKDTYELNIDEKLEKMFTITTINIDDDNNHFEFSVKNNTKTDIKYLEVKLTLYDENGTAITSNTSGYIEDIPKNQIKEDRIGISYSSNYSYYKYSIDAICVDGSPIIRRNEFDDELISFIANGIPFNVN